MDGIGGNLKQFVREKILAQDLLVNSAADFVEVASRVATEVILVTVEDIKIGNASLKLSTIIKNSKKIEDIKKNHFFFS